MFVMTTLPDITVFYKLCDENTKANIFVRISF